MPAAISETGEDFARTSRDGLRKGHEVKAPVEPPEPAEFIAVAGCAQQFDRKWPGHQQGAGVVRIRHQSRDSRLRCPRPDAGVGEDEAHRSLSSQSRAPIGNFGSFVRAASSVVGTVSSPLRSASLNSPRRRERTASSRAALTVSLSVWVPSTSAAASDSRRSMSIDVFMQISLYILFVYLVQIYKWHTIAGESETTPQRKSLLWGLDPAQAWMAQLSTARAASWIASEIVGWGWTVRASSW
jgi:hypothetical protein